MTDNFDYRKKYKVGDEIWVARGTPNKKLCLYRVTKVTQRQLKIVEFARNDGWDWTLSSSDERDIYDDPAIFYKKKLEIKLSVLESTKGDIVKLENKIKELEAK